MIVCICLFTFLHIISRIKRGLLSPQSNDVHGSHFGRPPPSSLATILWYEFLLLSDFVLDDPPPLNILVYLPVSLPLFYIP